MVSTHTSFLVNDQFNVAVKNILNGGSSGSPPPPSGSYHQIHPNGDTSKCLDVEAANYANGTPVDM